jgi:hypothetical protein
VVASALGDEAPALGAVRLALDTVERQVFAVEGGAAIPEPPSFPARPARRLQKSV